MIFRRKSLAQPTVDPTLLQEIEHVKRQMSIADQNFQSAMDPDLIDSYIYECNAAWMKYRFLLRQAKNH